MSGIHAHSLYYMNGHTSSQCLSHLPFSEPMLTSPSPLIYIATLLQCGICPSSGPMLTSPSPIATLLQCGNLPFFRANAYLPLPITLLPYSGIFVPFFRAFYALLQSFCPSSGRLCPSSGPIKDTEHSALFILQYTYSNTEAVENTASHIFAALLLLAATDTVCLL